MAIREESVMPSFHDDDSLCNVDGVLESVEDDGHYLQFQSLSIQPTSKYYKMSSRVGFRITTGF